MRKNIRNQLGNIGCFGAVVFSLFFISTATAMTTTQHQTMVQEKLIYITVSLEFFFLVTHKVCSRVPYAFFTNRRGR